MNKNYKVLSEFYGNEIETNKVIVVFNGLRQRYEVMHDGVLVDSCLTEQVAQNAAEDYINEKGLWKKTNFWIKKRF